MKKTLYLIAFIFSMLNAFGMYSIETVSGQTAMWGWICCVIWLGILITTKKD